KVFLRDGYHQTIVFLFRERKLRRLMALRPRDQRDKYLMMRGVAKEVKQLHADAVISISEVWKAPADPARPYMRAEESSARRELLSAILISKEGSPVEFSAEIE